jgi:hypothetical protein
MEQLVCHPSAHMEQLVSHWYPSGIPLLSLIHMKERDSDILVWVWGQRKMSQVLGVFRLLDFTISLGTHFETCELFIYFILLLFGGPWYTTDN